MSEAKSEIEDIAGPSTSSEQQQQQNEQQVVATKDKKTPDLVASRITAAPPTPSAESCNSYDIFEPPATPLDSISIKSSASSYFYDRDNTGKFDIDGLHDQENRRICVGG
ncbi:uncharacterized protein LOC121466743 isoform X2 [Drosophila elegans]|uniref:uncharacterized protein LOC121466743 isoform X2 n=1 Tax=Drosophila elegans TaxID=30023 RepID=UPI001BC83F77|nr:uncharacterized protein LOC121466743 isoform X2 [Drosophila elegans]